MLIHFMLSSDTVPDHNSTWFLARVQRTIEGRSECEGLTPVQWVNRLKRSISGQTEYGYIQRGEFFSALADPNRIRIADVLAKEGELCVCEIQAAIGQAQPLTSHHLNVLRRAHVVEARKKGRWMYYRLNEGISELLAQTVHVLDVRQRER